MQNHFISISFFIHLNSVICVFVSKVNLSYYSSEWMESIKKLQKNSYQINTTMLFYSYKLSELIIAYLVLIISLSRCEFQRNKTNHSKLHNSMQTTRHCQTTGLINLILEKRPESEIGHAHKGLLVNGKTAFISHNCSFFHEFA